MTVHKRKRRGPDPLAASDLANGRGKWKVRQARVRGSFYAGAESFAAPAGNCPDVRSGLVEI